MCTEILKVTFGYISQLPMVKSIAEVAQTESEIAAALIVKVCHSISPANASNLLVINQFLYNTDGRLSQRHQSRILKLYRIILSPACWPVCEKGQNSWKWGSNFQSLLNFAPIEPKNLHLSPEGEICTPIHYFCQKFARHILNKCLIYAYAFTICKYWCTQSI